MESRILRCPAVVRRTGLSKASIYRMIKAGKFPKPIKLGVRAVGWPSDDVEAWIRRRREEEHGVQL